MMRKGFLNSALRVSKLCRCLPVATTASALLTILPPNGRPISSLALKGWDMLRSASFDPPNPLLETEEDVDFGTVRPDHLVSAANEALQKYKSRLESLEEALETDPGSVTVSSLLENLEELEAPLDYVHNAAALYKNLIQIPDWEAAAYKANLILADKPHELSINIAEALERFDNELQEDVSSERKLAIRHHLNNYSRRGVLKGQDSSLLNLQESLDEIESRFVQYADMSSRTSTRKKLEEIYGMISLKKQYAKKCGYDNYVDFILATENRMATSQDEIKSLHSLVKEKFSYAKTRTFIKYEDTQQYLSIDGVLLGIFGLARALFGIVFHEVDSPRGWVSDVRLFTAADEATGEELGKLYLDPFFRGTKARYFFLSPLARNSMFMGAPIQPTAWSDEPTPLKFEDAVSLVHELGHALHFLLAKNQLVATHHMPHEVSEVMPQLMEHFLFDEAVLQTLAHLSGSESIPPKLVEMLREQRVAEKVHILNQRAFLGQLELELFSDLDESLVSLQRRLAQESVPLDLPDKNDLAALFKIMHDNACGRNICHYRYLYGEIMSADIYSLFQESGVHNQEKMRELGTRLRKSMLEPGGLVDGSASFSLFMGRDPSTDALFEMYGIENSVIEETN
mmetsp:Transcript_30132/g.54518  ORF Transcript_30132/g.54518 Transcript_30132/m.54518 type:complete len:627 (-) Transcript_30132:109-1989(-)